MASVQKLLADIELLSVEGIQYCFENGINPNDDYNGKPLFYELIGGYARGDEFKKCVKLFVDSGVQFPSKELLAALMDDAVSLDNFLANDREAIHERYTLDCAFTPLYEASLLHICAEFNHLECAKILMKYGADINQKAGIDEHGFGGETPVFHTVNQHANKCMDVMNYLVSRGADLSITVKGLIWGENYPWETFIPSVNPLSYAMMGLLPQFQRKDSDVYEVIGILLKAAYGIDYTPSNVPNKYLRQ